MSARTILKHVYENGGMTEYQYERIDRVLKERERPHGEWTKLTIYESTCSCCKNVIDRQMFVELPNFCPNCGSDNRPRKQGCCFASEECAKNPCEDCGLRGEAEC